MSRIFDADDRRRQRFWNTAPPDPTRLAKKSGTPYFRHGDRSRPLTPHSFMPVGPHASKQLHAVPPDYLLWVHQQPWSRTWAHWQPVTSYIERYLLTDPDTSDTIAVPTGQLIFVDPIQQWPTPLKCFAAGSSHLHTLPGHLDLLETFAIGALGLEARWLQHKECPHFDLTIRKHDQAIHAGAVEIDRKQMAAHQQLWRDFRDARPAPAADLPSPPRLPRRLR
jgi:hypothetical protein